MTAVATKLKKPVVKNLGKLNLGKKQILALMLPSDAKTIIVNYSGSSPLRITCGVSAMDRKVVVRNWRTNSDRKTKIHTPSILISAKYGDIPKCADRGQHYIYGFDVSAKKKIWAAVYALSNVYKDGRICFGRHYPKNLRAAYNLFWNAPFNAELEGNSFSLASSVGVGEMGVKEFVKKYEEKIFARQDWVDYTNLICGSKFWASPTSSDAVLVTANKILLKQIPKKYWRRRNGIPIFIGKATKLKKSWSFNSGTVKFLLPHANVAT